MDFEKLNQELYLKASHYKFAKKPTDFDRGYMKISDWINDLCWYYASKRKSMDKEMEEEFRALLQAQKDKIFALKPSAYRSGLLKALEEIG